MARIRTVKPAFFKHAELYDAELETGLPLRIAFAGMWTVADREGRFKWKPRDIKTEVLPHDVLDFSRVLDALLTRGFLEQYEAEGETYGWIPTFKDHQYINNKESASTLPPPPTSRKKKLNKNNGANDATTTRTLYSGSASGTRAPRDTHATSGEGKGSLTTLPPITPGDTSGSGSLKAPPDRPLTQTEPELVTVTIPSGAKLTIDQYGNYDEVWAPMDCEPTRLTTAQLIELRNTALRPLPDDMPDIPPNLRRRQPEVVEA